jgi:hypothetical protein
MDFEPPFQTSRRMPARGAGACQSRSCLFNQQIRTRGRQPITVQRDLFRATRLDVRTQPVERSEEETWTDEGALSTGRSFSATGERATSHLRLPHVAASPRPPAPLQSGLHFPSSSFASKPPPPAPSAPSNISRQQMLEVSYL